MKRFLMISLLLLSLAGVPGVAPAASAQRLVQRFDQEQVFRDRRDFKLLSYGEIKKRAENRFEGRVINQRLQPAKESAPPCYMLRIVRKDGSVIDVLMDARTAAVLNVKGGQ